jgi:mono/diheme cytochrome c family protein
VKTALKILAAPALVLLIGVVGVYAWAWHRDDVLLGREVVTHRADFPIPFPLTDAELDSVRQERLAAGATRDPLAGLDLDSIARARAVSRGDHLVHARYGCVQCHGQDFGGGVMVDNPMIGRLLGPNITAGVGGRTRDFTSSDWDRIVRHGVKHDGLPAVMPSVDFQYMSDQELSDIVSYIRSRPKVDKTVPPPHLGPLGRVLVATGGIPLSADLIPDHMAAHPKYPPPTDTTAAFGEHLAAVCKGCHGPDLSGGPIPGGDPSWPRAMNLTPHADGLAGWTYERFATVLRTGKRPDGTELRAPMAGMIPYTQHMTAVETHALWAYLSALPAVASKK